MTTAQSIIESAYARSTSNDAGKLAGDGELLNHLNRKYQSLYAIMAAFGGDNALASIVLNFAGGPPAAAALPVDAIDVIRVEQANGTKAYLIPANEKDRSWHLAPSMYRQGASLVSRAQAGDPGAGTPITLFYLDAPTALTLLASVLDARFPARYEEILVLDLAIYLSVKDEGRTAEEYKQLKDEYRDAMDAFNLLVRGSNSAKERPAPSQAATKD